LIKASIPEGRSSRGSDASRSGGLDRLLVGIGNHPGIGHDRDLSQLVGGHERGDRQ
jgi:hypothetical protein